MNLSSCEEFIQEYKKGESNIEYPILDDKDFLDCAKQLIAQASIDGRKIVFDSEKKVILISGVKNDK